MFVSVPAAPAALTQMLQLSAGPEGEIALSKNYRDSVFSNGLEAGADHYRASCRGCSSCAACLKPAPSTGPHVFKLRPQVLEMARVCGLLSKLSIAHVARVLVA